MPRFFLFLMVLLLLLPACARQDELFKETRVIMGTYVTITAERGGMPEDKVRAAVGAAFGEIERVDRLMSTYKPESQLSEVNRRAGVYAVKVDPEVTQTVGYGLYMGKLTDGAFDITVGPLVKLWKIGGEDARLPNQDEIARAKVLVDYRKVEVDQDASSVFIRGKGMSVDLGGIAKGYSSDLAVAKLKEMGVAGGIVAVAGDLKLFGSRPDGKPWSVGIQHPREKGTLMAKLDATDCAVSTSGDYERYFIKDGVRYHHIIDPATGYPARGLVSVTVLAKDSWLADSLATGLFVLGKEKAWALAQAHLEVEVLMVGSDGKVMATGRFKGMKVEPVRP